MRIGIVNDMALATEALRRVVLSDSRHQVAWTARDGEEAVRLCARDTPDVVLMDLVMPGMSGADATREIMRHSPCAVLVVTATVAGNYDLVCEALKHGAYDAVATPVIGNVSPAVGGADMLAKLSRVDNINRHIRSGHWQETEEPVRPSPPAAPAITLRNTVPLVAIGSSTGGPAALEAILSQWPADFRAAILIAQHVGPEFAGPLAAWLNERCPLKVRTAVPGDVPQAGTVLLAATTDHMVMADNGVLEYAREPRETPYRPSVDTLFQSLLKYRGRPGVAMLLTGIGSDGAAGLLRLREAGWMTVAQDKATSVVYGMPQAAAALGAAARVLALGDMPAFVEDWLRRNR